MIRFMKALVLEEYKRLVYQDVPEPKAGPDEVLIAVRACGVCGSDVHGLDGSTDRRRPPIIMGHEAAGVICRLGSGVTDWKAGDRVTFDSTVYCGQCPFCRAGRINLCNHRRVLGVSCQDYRQHGAFAELVAVPQRVLYRLPEGLSFEHAAMVEPVSIAVHAVRRASLALNDSAVVVGAGMIGLFIIQALRLAGCGKIIAVDLAPEKLKLALELGAGEVIQPGAKDALAQVLALTNGCGADAVFEAVGLGPTVDLAVRAARKGGSVTLVGNLSPKVELPLQTVVTGELSLLGSCASCGEYPACLEMIARGAIRVAPLLSAHAPLEEGAAWFDRLYRNEPGLFKVVLAPGPRI
jgi:L-iditol 2-dehydrogenase